MAYTLNTSHPLYSNLIELIGVQSGALVSHKTARTFTPNAAASFGSGTWGEHFHAASSSYTDKGASFTPALSINTGTVNNYTIVTVLNASGNGANYAGQTIGQASSPRLYGAEMRNNHIYTRGMEGATAVGTGNRMLTHCRIGETSGKIYLDKTLEVSAAGTLGADYNDPAASANYIGRADQVGIYDVVWIAVFDKELSLAEISSLYDSLGASNAFGLVGSSVPTASYSVTTDAAVFSGSAGPISKGSFTITASDATVSGGATGNLASGTITTPALKNNTGTVLANQTAVSAFVYNVSTGALVVAKSGLSTNASGVLTFSDGLVMTGTTYRVVIVLASGAEGMDKVAAT